MFGTLVVSLPSYHEGGDLRISYHGIVTHYSTSMNNPSITAWYSDVTHEVLEVTNGYRLVLTYNLVDCTAGAKPTASLLDHSEPLHAATRQWLEQSKVDKEAPHQFIYLLEHKYTDSSLGFFNLKTDDLSRAKALQASCHGHGVALYLASLEFERSGDLEYNRDNYSRKRRRGRYGHIYDDDDDDDDECGPGGYHPITAEYHNSLKLKRVVDMHGMEVAADLPIEED